MQKTVPNTMFSPGNRTIPTTRLAGDGTSTSFPCTDLRSVSAMMMLTM